MWPNPENFDPEVSGKPIRALVDLAIVGCVLVALVIGLIVSGALGPSSASTGTPTPSASTTQVSTAGSH